MNDQDLRREEFCIPLRGPWSARGIWPVSDFDDDEELFFCRLGTLGCTEAHGDWEDAHVERLVRERQRLPRRRASVFKTIRTRLTPGR